MRTRTIITLAMLVAAAAAVAPSASAETTDATFAVAPIGGLGITVPASTVDLGSVNAGTTTYTASLGTVTVTDNRADIIAEWSVSVTGTHFDNQSVDATPETDANHRVANTAVTYTAVPSLDSGIGTPTPSVGTLAAGSGVVFAGSGSNVVSWNPTLGFTLLPTQSAGTYKGTITHSVS